MEEQDRTLRTLFKELFTILEERMVRNGRRPLSLDPNLHFIEEKIVEAWQHGANPTLANTLSKMSVGPRAIHKGKA